jgi:hypothetical protein
MSPFLAIGWRLLLAISLVANPLAAAAIDCHAAPVQAAAASKAEAMPPCHGHDMAMATATAAKPLPSKHDGHDCGKAGCDFATCCAAGLLTPESAIPAAMLVAQHGGCSEGARALAAPPPLPLIRPPIA